MKTATAKDLKQKTAAILDEVERGQEIVVTRRGRSIARIAPLPRSAASALTKTGFGMWRDRADLRDMERWIDRVRAPRHRRSRSTPTS
jgi:prevent-host-death family protein